MTAVALSLLAAAVWGGSDFVGGMTSRSLRPLTVVLWVNLVGLVACGAVALAAGSHISGAGLGWCAAAGVASGVGFVTFYAALSSGSMSLVAPVTASGAAVPAIVAVARGDTLSVLLVVGLLCAFAGTVLAARPAGTDAARIPPRALALALTAALAIGAILALLQRATDTAGTDALGAVTATRFFALIVCGALVAVAGGPVAVPPALRRNVALIGVADTAANALFALASMSGDHAVAAVLSSLYPVTTVLLARIVLSERLSAGQGGGVALALTGVALVSAGS